MGKINIILSILLIFSSPVYATDCTKSVQPINQGDVATCTGYLFSPDAESEAWKTKRIADLQAEENKILEKRLELYIKQSDVLANELGKKKTTEDIYRLGYFVLGVLVTGVIVSNVNR